MIVSAEKCLILEFSNQYRVEISDHFLGWSYKGTKCGDCTVQNADQLSSMLESIRGYDGLDQYFIYLTAKGQSYSEPYTADQLLSLFLKPVGISWCRWEQYKDGPPVLSFHATPEHVRDIKAQLPEDCYVIEKRSW